MHEAGTCVRCCTAIACRATVDNCVGAREHPDTQLLLLLFDGSDMVYTSNHGATEILTPGYYGLSNAELGARWPKCVQGAVNLQSIVEAEHTDEDLINLLADQHIPPDDELPHRGRPIEMERRVAPCFINGDEYGTRASTLVRISARNVHFVEQGYLAGGVVSDRTTFDLERTQA